MITLKDSDRIYQMLKGGGSVDENTEVLLKTMPSAVRRMGLVRSIEWLAAGTKNRSAGQRLFSYVGPKLGLPPLIPDAVKTLEECERRTLFRVHQDAITLFDQLSMLHRAGASA